jgi:hypothetical protein
MLVRLRELTGQLSRSRFRGLHTLNYTHPSGNKDFGCGDTFNCHPKLAPGPSWKDVFDAGGTAVLSCQAFMDIVDGTLPMYPVT